MGEAETRTAAGGTAAAQQDTRGTSSVEAALRLTFFEREDDAQVWQAGEVPWGELARFFQDARSPRSVPKHDLSLWSAATFHDAYRSLGNVESVSCLALDDDIAPVTLEQLRCKLAGRAAIVMSTSSSRPAAPTRRIILRLSRPAQAAEWPTVWTRVVAGLGFEVGQASKDSSRQWFMPRDPEEGEFLCEELAGAPVDVDAVLGEAPWAAERVAVVVPEGPAAPEGRVAEARRWLREKARPSRWDGGGGAACLNAAAKLVQTWELNDAQALAALRDEFNPRCTEKDGTTPSPWSDEDLARKISEARTKYKTTLVAPAWFARWADGAANDATPAGQEDESKPPRRSLAESFLAREHESKRARVSTGLPLLDDATRGGLPFGTFVVVGGAPGAGKTTLCVQWGYQWAKAGWPVVILAADEPGYGLETRVGQLAGFDREKLETGDGATLARCAEVVRLLPLRLLDLDLLGTTLEDEAAQLVEPTIVIMDSLQMMLPYTRASGGLTDRRFQIDAVIAMAKSIAKRGHLVLATSELTRAGYKNRNNADNIDPLAAFKESGGIEYGGALALLMRSRKGVHNLVDVEVPKNRIGPKKPSLVLQQDFERASFHQFDTPAEVILGPVEKQKEAVLAYLTENALPMSRTALAGVVGGRRTTALQAINDLLDERKLVEDPRNRMVNLPHDELTRLSGIG